MLYLYGESHGSQAVLDRELELWREYYAQGMRHLFIEYPYYTAQLLNEWMAAEEDTTISYAVEGGNIYFDPETGTITDCDTSVTRADIPGEIQGVPSAASLYST